ncbi:MAG: ATP-binding protein, partial [Gammaproteobacteria bacterium]|nr:ATP-binding protein [Gammaproteobacteria bacterium]
DPALLDQVLVNVVTNAVDAAAGMKGPEIRLTARLDVGRTVIRITDNGPGIDEDARDQVFVPFFTTKRQGSGIGLSLCRQVMTAHGGEIAIDSGESGTTVSLVF